ncbi:5'-nucleotidase [Leucobacter sp. M11]|uniref:5'-nucleotidase n=1 Tax=Leucobacter sp. M11 TaxID=2993565 RepID=UPI002D7FA61F|nr:5'-nucleotidase [Leucobacter sp. M11]MEB4616353.1 5'-nucleotidase [Leucobacter sp. M11]
MAYDLQHMLVLGVASSALFDLAEADAVFQEQGEARYREYQEAHLDHPLQPGAAFPFITRLLSLNDLAPDDAPLVEVIVLSRNDPDTGLRVMRSIAHHDLPITRAIFMQGRSPYAYMGALNMSLFLSQNEHDVRVALDLGFAAGQVIGSPAMDPKGTDLRIAFDFDGVLADDSSERVMQAGGLSAFHANERARAAEPLPEGRLSEFLRGINRIQDIEEALLAADPGYNRRVHVAIVTARNAPSHERVIRTLTAWGVRVNDAFFLGGIDKARVLRVLKPHVFFDDQIGHLEGAADEVPSVHVPFGVINEADAPPGANAATTRPRHA